MYPVYWDIKPPCLAVLWLTVWLIHTELIIQSLTISYHDLYTVQGQISLWLWTAHKVINPATNYIKFTHVVGTTERKCDQYKPSTSTDVARSDLSVSADDCVVVVVGEGSTEAAAEVAASPSVNHVEYFSVWSTMKLRCMSIAFLRFSSNRLCCLYCTTCQQPKHHHSLNHHHHNNRFVWSAVSS